jgi:hypothetical protein
MHCWHYGEGDLGNSCNMSLFLSWWCVAVDLVHIQGEHELRGSIPFALDVKGGE